MSIKAAIRCTRLVGIIGCTGIAVLALAQKPVVKTGSGAAQVPAVQSSAVKAPVLLNYGFEPGKTYHYKVVALFSGEIPGFNEPGKDAYIKAELYYSASPTKQDAKGTSVMFKVEGADLSVLAK